MWLWNAVGELSDARCRVRGGHGVWQDRGCGSNVCVGVPLVGLWLGNAVRLCCVGKGYLGDTWAGLGLGVWILHVRWTEGAVPQLLRCRLG